MSALKPKVLMVGPALDVRGGISTVSTELLENGLRERADVEYVASMVDGSKLRKALQAIGSLARFKRMLPSCDVVHIHISKGASFYRKELFAKTAAAKGVPFLLHEHDGEFDRAFDSGDEAYRSRVRSLFGMASKVIVLSEEWRDYFAANVCEPERIVVLHNAVKAPGASYIDGRFAGGCPRQDILFLGRLAARKSPDVLLRAASSIAPRFSGMRLLFGGDGHLQRYEQLAEELGIADRCEFLGWVTGEDKEWLFERAAVYCLPSKFEGMPMSVLEAMGHGLPTISTPVGGVPQVIEDGVDGFLMRVDDTDGLAVILAQLLSDAALRERIGRAANEKIRSSFNVERNVEYLINLYRMTASQKAVV